ncbi:MAG: hypothetical protein E7300_09750 [Lachnospiraceae bacterium]|nr:hypothetical protein [Lachnospiraceae bacterium]
MMGTSLVACICEGASEREIITKLLDEGKLIFDRAQLLDKEVLRCRSPRDFEEKYLSKGFDEKITVYRILDSRREKFNLRAAYRDKVDVISVITAPEIEMLVIITEEKFADYAKVKSTQKPSDYCKTSLKYPNVKDPSFNKMYFNDVRTLISAIKKYKKLSKLPNKEKCLADILR